MKYGLPREEKPKKKWKTAIENELRCLKMEVCFLKDQLNDAKNQLAAWTSPNRLNPFFVIQGFSRNDNQLPLFLQNDSNNNFPNRNESQPPITIDFSINSNERVVPATNSLASPQVHPFSSVSMGTDAYHYEPTWDYDSVTRKSLRMHSISCMPCYEHKSFEELRLGDYMNKGIGFSSQIQSYKDSIQRSARSARNDFSFTPKKWKTVERKDSEELKTPSSSFSIPWYLAPTPPVPWPWCHGPSSENKKSNSPASDSVAASVPQTSNDVKVQDEQNKSRPLFSFQRNADAETKLFSDFADSKKDENVSSQILSELRKVGEQMSAINDRLLTMDTNMSDLSSKVSVMDSRLSAVDMFVTMQRFDQKWQDFKIRLENLENPSPAKATTLPSNVGNIKDTCWSSKGPTLKWKTNISCSFNKKINNTETTDFGKLDATVTSPNNDEAGRFINNKETTDFGKPNATVTSPVKDESGRFINNTETTDFGKPNATVTSPNNDEAGIFINNTETTDFGKPNATVTSPNNDKAGIFINNTETTDFGKPNATITSPVNDKAGIFINNTETTDFGKPNATVTSPVKDESRSFINNTETTDFGKSNKTATSPVKDETGRLSTMDISDMNLSDFVRSVSCSDTTKGSSSSLDVSTVSNSPLKIKLDNAPIEMADLKSCNFEPASALVENLSPRENESLICNSESVASVPANNKKQSNESKNEENNKKICVMCQGVMVTPEGEKVIHKPELQIVTLDKDSSNGLIVNDPLGVTEQNNSTANISADLLMKEVENDAENEFVIVEKSDVEESVEETSKVKSISSPLHGASSSSEFKMYSDITEYLEINLGKKKKSVYEFGFEAKPSYSPESEDQEQKSDGNQENRVSTSSADNSFQQFKIDFIENKSVHEKQSSPFVFCSSKSPDNWNRRKFRKAVRQNVKHGSNYL